MSEVIHLDVSKLIPFVRENELKEMQAMVTAADQELREGTDAGNDFRGQIGLSTNYDKGEFDHIKKAAEKIQSDSEVLAGIGIGGSCFGAQASVEFLNSSFYDREKEKCPIVVSCDNSLLGLYLCGLSEWLGDRGFSVNITSKPGTATEPSIAFRVLKDKLIKEYGKEETAKRIYATTDCAKGALKTEVDAEDYEELVVPDDISSRFSVPLAVGLLPITVAGGDIGAMMKDTADACAIHTDPDVSEGDPYQYVALRNTLYRKSYTTELLENYELSLRMFGK